MIHHVLRQEHRDDHWQSTALSIYRQRVYQMDTWELRQIINTMNRSTFGDRLKTTGTRETLISSILQHAEQRLLVDSGRPIDKISQSEELEDNESDNVESSDDSDGCVAFDDSDSIDEDDAIVVTRNKPSMTSDTGDDMVLLSDDSDEESTEEKGAVDCTEILSDETSADVSHHMELPVCEQRSSPSVCDVPTAAVISVQDPEDVAKRVFGIDAFRDGQR